MHKFLLHTCILILPLCAMGQGFGFSDHVYLSPVPRIAPVVPVPTNILNNLAYWWVASDLPDGQNNSWTDRIYHFVLTNAATTFSPIKTNDYVSYYSTNYGYSNQLAVTLNNNLVWWIASIKIPWGDGDEALLLGTMGSLRGGYAYRSNKNFQYAPTAVFWDMSGVTNGVIHDGAFFGSANICKLYTNSVLVATNDIGGGNFIQWITLCIGAGGNSGVPINSDWKFYNGKIYEVFMTSNSFQPTLQNLQDLHKYATNKYGYTP